MDRFTLEEIAGTSEWARVRRRFDERNLWWSYGVAGLFVVASIFSIGFSLGAKGSGLSQRLLAVGDAALTLTVLIALWRIRRGQARGWSAAVQRNPTPWLLAMYLSKLVTCCYLSFATEGAFIWGYLFPFLALGLRLLLGPRVFLHVSILVIVLAATIPGGRKDGGAYAALFIVNAMVFGITTWASVSLKKSTMAEWGERRRDAFERLRIRDELRFAREVQVSMLPDAPPELPWADVDGVSIPATEVGGDYFDYFDVDGRLAIVCGDVAGHGLASGLALSAMRSGFTLLRASLLDPAHVLTRLQEVVTTSSRKRMMATVAVLLLDPESGQAVVASAGHPPILLRRNTGVVEPIELFAPPLGARLGSSIPQRQLAFESGDVFVLHTDGIYETTNAAGEHFGIERLSSIVSGARGNAAEIREHILRSLDAFRGAVPQEDDVTVVVVQIS